MNKIIQLILSFLLIAQIRSQDIHYTQYFNQSIELNPALAGATLKGARVQAIYRNQWANIVPAYQTVGASVDLPIPSMLGKNNVVGMGLQFYNDKSGSSSFQRNNLKLAVAYHRVLVKDMVLSFGIDGGFTNSNFKTNNLTFADQYNAILQNVNTTQVNIPSNSLFAPSLNAGVNLAVPFAKILKLTLGASFNNLISQKKFFIKQEANYLRYVAHAQLDIQAGKKVKISPQFLFMKQGPTTQINVGGLVQYTVFKEFSLTAGVQGRIKDAVNFLAGIGYGDLKIMYSYDMNNSTLRNDANVRPASHEVSLSYIFPFKKKIAKDTIAPKKVIIDTPETVKIDTPIQMPEIVAPKINDTNVLKGEIWDKAISKPVPGGARLELFEKMSNGDYNLIQQLEGVTDYSFNLKNCKNYKIKVTKDGYFTSTSYVASRCNEPGITTNEPILLEKIDKGKAYSLKNIYYEFDKADLTTDSKNNLDVLYNLLSENPSIIVEIGSHTDGKGNANYNQALSQRRAESCVSYLIGRGINSTRMQAKGYGMAQPVATEKTSTGVDIPEGRAKNRRTEFKVIGDLKDKAKLIQEK